MAALWNPGLPLNYLFGALDKEEEEKTAPQR